MLILSHELIINYNLHNFTKAQFNKTFDKLKQNEFYNKELQEYVDTYQHYVFECVNEAKANTKDIIVLTEQKA